VLSRAGRSLLKRDVIVVALFVFDLWAVDVAYGQRRCRRKEGTPRMRDFVVVCYNTVGRKSLDDAGWLGRIVLAMRHR
jgi:hypothetical protein